MYKDISKFYDFFTNDMERDATVSFLEKCFLKFGNCGLKTVAEGVLKETFFDNGTSIENSSLVIDIGCGTGILTSMMADRGYDMTGLDISPEMLEIARNREECSGKSRNILWLCQDMTKMDTFGSYACMYCLEDGVNHLVNRDGLSKFIKRAYNFVDPNGLLIFDFLTDSYFEKVGKEGVFFDDEDSKTCVWTATYNKKKRVVHYDLVCFEKNETGKYERYDDEVIEHSRTLEEVKTVLTENNFKVLGIYKDFEMHKAKEKDYRIYIVARKIYKGV